MFLQAFVISIFNLIKEKNKLINFVILGTHGFMRVLNVLSVRVQLYV